MTNTKNNTAVKTAIPKQPGDAPVIIPITEDAGQPEPLGLPESPLWAGLNQAALQSIFALGRRRTYSVGSTVFGQGDCADSLYLLVFGDVRRYHTDTSGSRANVTTLSIVCPGEVFGHSALIRRERDATAQAESNSVCLEYPLADMIGLMVSIPTFSVNLSQTIVSQIMTAEKRIVDRGAGKWSYRRLAMALFELARTDGKSIPGGVLIDRTITQADLASLIGAARETVSLQLKRFSHEGVLRMDGRAIIIVPDKLKKYT